MDSLSNSIPRVESELSAKGMTLQHSTITTNVSGLTPIDWPRSSSVLLAIVAAILLAGAPFPGLAAPEVARIPIVDAPPQTPGIGGAFRSGSTPYIGDDGEPDLVPLYLYEGKRLFAHGTSVGIHAVNKERFKLDLLALYRFDQLDPSSSPFLEGMAKREQSVDAGISMETRRNWGDLKLAWTTDTTNRHEGQELDLSYRYRFDSNRWALTPFISYILQDENLTDYYYGVRPEEALPDRPAYEPGNSTIVKWGLNTSYQLTSNVRLFANVAFDSPSTEILDSPLVEDDLFATVALGGAYLFGDLERDTPYNPETEWSWRVNAGYSAEENIVGGISNGDFSASTVADTPIAGFTLGRLFARGRRLDWYGRVAVFRHFEDDIQDDFWNYTAYVQMIGKGFVPWTNQLNFRYGFGMGASYAQEVPVVEQRKQAARGRETSEFLNYLELFVDFSLAPISKATKNCFAGVTVVHRSGIFATADILGSVSGGSDWITLHLECLRG